MKQKVIDNPFIPLKWMKDHKGMQGTEYLDLDQDENLSQEWLFARDGAVNAASLLHDAGVTKQICNRLLEPFLWHTVIVTATEWENFFALRAHEAAEIHMQKIAYMMLEEYNKSVPKQLKEGDWHIPFADNMGGIRIQKLFNATSSWEVDEYKVKIATARCARISYSNFEGKDDYEADVKLHDMLAEMGHWSPFEHCAQVSMINDLSNFRGYNQYRKTFTNENKHDERVEKRTHQPS